MPTWAGWSTPSSRPREFKDADDDVRLIFDGAATQWPGVLADPTHQVHKPYEAVRDVISGACGFCAHAFHAEDGVQNADVELLSEYEGHPSIPPPRPRRLPGHYVLTQAR